MLTAKEVYIETLKYRQMNDLIAAGKAVSVNPDYVREFRKRRFDAPNELFVVFELINHAMTNGNFGFIGTKENCFAINHTPSTEAFSIPELEKYGFEITDIGDGQIQISWEKGLGLREEA